jgi:hypothetical protein
VAAAVAAGAADAATPGLAPRIRHAIEGNRDEKEHSVHQILNRGTRPLGIRALLAALLLPLAAGCPEADTQSPRTFETPEAAVEAFLDAVERDDVDAVLRIFGREHADAIVTPDWDAERESRQRITSAAKEKQELQEVAEGELQLIVGAEDWPFPIPIVREQEAWHFDTAEGIEEIIDRRIGRNELAAIAIARAYVDAQIEYSQADRDGDEVLEYAQRLASSPGKREGLYWEAGTDEEPSPFGPLVRGAERYLETIEPGDPIKGYYFQVLTRQGANPPGGRYDYVINGHMIAGFALVAYPADHGNSGVMTFVVNHRGKVHQKDLGAFDGMDEYDPDDTWTEVED